MGWLHIKREFCGPKPGLNVYDPRSGIIGFVLVIGRRQWRCWKGRHFHNSVERWSPPSAVDWPRCTAADVLLRQNELVIAFADVADRG